MSSEGFDVTVVGSNFMDLIGYANRLPKPGETLEGSDFQMGFGGKGANQCVAAARLGAKCAFVGKHGRDSNGLSYYENLKSEGINVDCVTFEEGVPNGVALILVGANDGQNLIVIVPGATQLVTPQYVEQVADQVIQNSKIVLCQCEIPVESTLKTLQLAKKHNVKSLLNVAPAVPNLPKELFSLTDILCLNESEAEIVTGIEKISTVEEAKEAIVTLRWNFESKTVIITLGSEGAVLFDHLTMTYHHVTAPKVQAIDTTGAGDCFVGTLAYCLAQGDVITKALEKSVQNASQSVLKKGTQSSFPHSLIPL